MRYKRWICFYFKPMKAHQHQEYKIAKLIAKSVAKTLSSHEKEELDKWLEDESAQKLFNKITDTNNLNAKYDFYQSVNIDKHYAQLNKKINRIKTIALVKQISKYAAVIVLCLSVSFVWYQQVGKQDATISKAALNELKPGYSKATLVLSDGSEVALDTLQNKNIQTKGLAQIQNKNNVLEYTISEVKQAGLINIGFNTLHVPIGGIYNLILPDGTKVWLNSATSIKYPEAFVGKTREVELIGEAYFEVVSNPEKPFVVNNQSLNVTVLGTAFNVSAYHDDAFFTTTLVEGKVKLASAKTQDIILTPNEVGFFNKSNSKLEIKKYEDIRNYTSWKDGKFYFERESLDNILKKLGRWYNFKVEFTDAKAAQSVFTGVAHKNYKIENLMDMIAKTARIRYQAYKNENNDILIKVSKKE